MKYCLLFALAIVTVFSSCGLFRSSYGCPTNGKNIGAERLLSGDAKAIKAAKKAGPFLGTKSF